MSSGEVRSGEFFPVGPGGVLVAVSPLLGVEGPCAFGDAQGGEGLAVEGVVEAGVVDEPGGYELPLAGGAGDGAGRGVVPAGLPVAVAVRVVAELCEHPGAEDAAQSGWDR